MTDQQMIAVLSEVFEVLKGKHNDHVKYAEALESLACALNWLEFGSKEYQG